MDTVGFRKLINGLKKRRADSLKQSAPLLLLIQLHAILIGGCASAGSSPLTASQPAPLSRAPAQSASASSAVTGQRRLTGAQPSAEALAGSFLEALARQDVEAIRRLRLTKEEFCLHVFPALPSSKVPNLSCDFAWSQATLRSDGGLYKLLPKYKGKRYELISLRFEAGPDSYKGYKVHKPARLLLKDENGAGQEVRLFGSMLELDGQFKLFSFVAD
jgi:hypothetical protein